MNCFIFNLESAVFPEICGRTPLDDLASHLKNSGIGSIYTDSESESTLVSRMTFSGAEQFLGETWLAAYEGMITRQSPGDLLLKTAEYSAEYALSLSCSGEPWKHVTFLTGKNGMIQSFQRNPSPDNAMTNMCFSGFVLVNKSGFDPYLPFSSKNTSAFLLPGYWSLPADRESYLRTSHDILAGIVSPWPGCKEVVMRSNVPESCTILGTLWLGKGCRVGENCTLENCVIMDSAEIGSGSSLKNCLVNPGASVRPGTTIDDKYLTLLGE